MIPAVQPDQIGVEEVLRVSQERHLRPNHV